MHDSFLGDSLAGLGRAVGAPARLATALLADVPFNGQINLLTSTSFDRPQDLFTADGLVPRGVAYLSLAAPTAGGEWTMRGAMTQGDLASWILAGSYRARAPARRISTRPGCRTACSAISAATPTRWRR